MAIWQYLLIVVPKNSIDQNYNIFENNKTEFLPDTNSYWENLVGSTSDIISELDQILPRAHWSTDTFVSWKGDDKNNEDNDGHISLTDDKSQIEELTFRIDLRKESNITNTLHSILDLCKKHNFVLIDLKGKIFEPNLEDILESIKTSNAARFLNDPIQFFEDLNKNNSNETRT
ncbi:hypothetical protein [Flavobacterium sp. H4147]|uniref:hypothetical protein n=1 Tax=Flavobacterium sp. H4147 TaxID=3034149 RepID=UPI0023EE107A|nr:hypothetical protein [Flavobacterium sp. H4147]